MHYVGKLDKNKLGKYAEKVITLDVVLTDERKRHIFNNHFQDYNIIMKNIDRIVLYPDEVLEDSKNIDTLFFIGKLNNSNLNVVVKLNTTNNSIHSKNSIMTAWLIRNSNLHKLRKKSIIIYKSE